MAKIIDSHVHIDMIAKYSQTNLALYKNSKVVTISWAFWRGIRTARQLLDYLSYQGSYVKEIASLLGTKCYYLTGIHPRNIPKNFKMDNKLFNVLLTNLAEKKCLGIGEIGLEKASTLEIKVLKIQLDMISGVKDGTLKIGIHTPRNNKYEITLKLLKILEKYNHLIDDIIIDHCTINTISMVLERGYMAGITLCPSKTKINELLSIAHKFENNLSKIVCNSDNGGSFSRYFFDIIESENILDTDLKTKLFFNNASNFFQIKNYKL